MRLQVLFILLLCNGALRVAAQANGVVVGGKWADQVSVTDVQGRPFENKYNDVIGSPYFNANYKFANLILYAGQHFNGIQTKINLVTQETVFITANNVEAYIEKGRVKEIVYADTTEKGIVHYRFQTGFPAIDKQNANNFYQVLVAGRCSFLKSTTKKITERKSELSGEIAKEFEATEDYYLFINNEMKRCKKDKTFILAQLADKQTELNQFIQSNKINWRSTEDLTKVFILYNTLQRH